MKQIRQMTHLLLPPWLSPLSVVDVAHASGRGGYIRGRARPNNQLEKYKKEEDEIHRILVSENRKTKQTR